MIRNLWMSILACAGWLCLAIPAAGANAATERHVVVVVWDGMRPDFVTQTNTPTLWRLAKQGVTFRNHHAVYPSVTNVNGAAIATGAYPLHSGIIANREYRPAINAHKYVETDDPLTVRAADDISGGKYLALPTIAEILRSNGRTTVVAGAKRIALVQDRQPNASSDAGGVTLFAGESVPSSAVAAIAARLGVFPNKKSPHLRDDWTTTALLDLLWKTDVPDFSLLWLGEPDLAEHGFAPGSKEALAATKSSDNNLGRVLAALDQRRLRDVTDIFVVSDHGFSTIARSIDLRKILRNAGFDAAEECAGELKSGQILLVGNGGTVLFYVADHESALVRRVVEFLQQSDFAGVIFAKEKLGGTFTLEQAGIGGASAPDIAMSFRWNDSKNQFGVSGMIDADWIREAGKGTHATLSRFEMHNMLIAAGPDFRRGVVDTLPTGNVDLAPTILRAFKITPPGKLDGRTLVEAMVDTDNEVSKAKTETIEAARKFPAGEWRQTLQISQVGSTIYLDHGSGRFVAEH